MLNDKNISKIRNNQGNKLHNLYLDNSYHNSVTTEKYLLKIEFRDTS